MGIEHRRGVVALALIAAFMVFVDGTIVNIALAQLASHLNATRSGLEWAVNAYTLSFAAVMLGAGAITDTLGAKRTFVAGLLVFTAASAVCATATSMLMFDSARLVQGAGAALLLPSALVLGTTSATDERMRHRLVGWWTAAGGIGMAAGPLLGGMLVALAGWRAVFAVNVVMGIPAIVWSLRSMPTIARRPRRLDNAGMGTATVLIGGLVFALIEAPARGWLSAAVIAAAALALAGLVGFVWAERVAPAPLLPPGVYTDRRFAATAAQGALFKLRLLRAAVRDEPDAPARPRSQRAGERTAVPAPDRRRPWLARSGPARGDRPGEAQLRPVVRRLPDQVRRPERKRDQRAEPQPPRPKHRTGPGDQHTHGEGEQQERRQRLDLQPQPGDQTGEQPVRLTATQGADHQPQNQCPTEQVERGRRGQMTRPEHEARDGYASRSQQLSRPRPAELASDQPGEQNDGSTGQCGRQPQPRQRVARRHIDGVGEQRYQRWLVDVAEGRMAADRNEVQLVAVVAVPGTGPDQRGREQRTQQAEPPPRQRRAVLALAIAVESPDRHIRIMPC